MSQTLEQIALRVADTAGLDNPQEFLACVKQVVAALGAQEPVAWRVVTKTTTGFSCWINYYDFGAAGSPLNNDGTWKEKHCHHWQFNDSPSKQLQLVSVEKLYAAPQLPQQQHSELLKIHTILMCPAECPPVSDNDTLTVKMLKEIIHAWHKQIPTHEGQQRIFEELDLLVTLLKGWPTSIATSEGFRAVRSIRKAMLAAAPKLGDS